MKTIQPLALSVAMALVACGHEEPSNTAYQASSPQTSNPPAQANTTAVNETPMAAGHVDSTSADVPREGPNAGNPVAPEHGAAEAQAVTAMTDDEILEITHTANTGEIDQAKIALSKTKDARVRKLAQMMVRDHLQSNSKGDVVAKKDHLTLEASPASQSLAHDADGATRTLKAQEAGAAFDKDYVETQIREHQSLLDSLDQQLIPAAKSPNVKAYLVEVRAAVASHLEHAEDVSKALGQ